MVETLISKPIGVLIVDDNPVFLTRACRLVDLEHEFLVLGTAESGIMAVHQARALQPAVILLDQQMPPGWTGLDTVPHLRQVSPHSRIILLTFDGNARIRQAAQVAGVDGFIQKSELIHELRRTLIRCVHQKAA